MATLTDLLNNPLGLALVLFLIAFVVGINLTLFSLLSGKRKASTDEAAKWSKAFRSGFDAHKQQMSDLEDLHRRVGELDRPNKPE